MEKENKKPSLIELLNQYSEFLNTRLENRATILMYKCPVKELIEFVDERIKKPKDIKQELLMDFQKFIYEEFDFSFKTVESYFFRIKHFFDYLNGRDIIKQNPAKNIPILPKPQAPKQIISRYYSFDELIRRYINKQREWLSYEYLHQIEKHLNGFFKYLRTQDHNTVYKVTEGIILKYREYLWNEHLNHTQKALVVKSQRERLRCICRFFRYLYKEGILRKDPTKDLGWKEYYKQIYEKAKSLPKQNKPKSALTPLDKLKMKFLEYEISKGKAKSTITGYKRGLEIFFEFLKIKGISTMAQVEKRTLLDYYTYLYNYKSKRNQEVTSSVKARYLWSVRAFTRFLTRFDYIPKDPAFDLESIKEERGLPKSCMNEREVLKVLEAPKLDQPLGVRDKAILEVLFSTGIRANELRTLNMEDIDYAQGIVRINTPKGGNNHQRVIPIGKTALNYLTLYLRETRPKIENGDRNALFLSYSGKRVDTDCIWKTVKKYAFEAGLRKPISPHSFRVTCATLMLKNGADIRYVQEQLGHRRITSTQIYTRLTPVDLKQIHTKFHPRERKNNEKLFVKF